MAYKFNPFTGNLDFVGEGGEEVFSFNDATEFPLVGESGKLYIDRQTNISYHWKDERYVPVTSGKEIVVTSVNNLPPANDDGAIQLENNKTYRFSGLVTLPAGQYIQLGNSNTLMGFDKSDDGITGNVSGAIIRGINRTCSVNFMLVTNPGGTLFDFQNETNHSVQIKDCILGSAQGVGRINNGFIVTIQANVFSSTITSTGFEFSGTIQELSIDSNYFLNRFSNILINIHNLSANSIKICNNVMRVDAPNIGVKVQNITFTNNGNGEITATTFLGTSQISSRVVGIDDDTNGWYLENNTGLVDTSSGYSPNTIKVLTDDFFVGGTETGEIGQYNWSFVNGSMSSVTSSQAGRPGVIRRSTSTTANQFCSLFMGRATNAPNFAYSDWVSLIWIGRNVDDVTTTRTRWGMALDWGVLNPTHGVYFENDLSTGTIHFVSRNNSVETRVDTGIEYNNLQYYKFEAIKTDNGIRYKIDGVELGVIETNIPDPNDLLHFGMYIYHTTSVVRSADIDYFSAIIKTNNR